MLLRQVRVARAVPLPGALFRAGAFAFPPCAPKSHMRPLPHLGVSDDKLCGSVGITFSCMVPLETPIALYPTKRPYIAPLCLVPTGVGWQVKLPSIPPVPQLCSHQLRFSATLAWQVSRYAFHLYHGTGRPEIIYILHSEAIFNVTRM